MHDMKNLTKKLQQWMTFACLSACLSLVSCAELFNTMVETDLTYAVNNAKPTDAKSKKAVEKEEKQLKQQGKCPSCHGMGKTPDGLYDCPKCKGTGKINPST